MTAIAPPDRMVQDITIVVIEGPAACPQRVRGRRQIICAMDDRDAPRSQTADVEFGVQRVEGLGGTDRPRLPIRVGQDEMLDDMIERFPVERDRQRAHAREITHVHGLAGSLSASVIIDSRTWPVTAQDISHCAQECWPTHSVCSKSSPTYQGSTRWSAAGVICARSPFTTGGTRHASGALKSALVESLYSVYPRETRQRCACLVLPRRRGGPHGRASIIARPEECQWMAYIQGLLSRTSGKTVRSFRFPRPCT